MKFIIVNDNSFQLNLEWNWHLLNGKREFSHFCVVLLHSIECYYTVQNQLISTQWFLKNSAIRRKLIICAVSVRQRSSSRWTPCDLTPFLLTKNQNLSVWLTLGQFTNLPHATWCRPWKTTKNKKTVKREVGIVVNLVQAWCVKRTRLRGA